MATKSIKVDTGFGRVHSIEVPSGATMSKIKEECLAQTGENLFCVLHSSPLVDVKINEW